MTQTKILRKARSLTAAVVGTLFLFTTVAAPVAEANFWEQRRDATRRVNGKAPGPSSPLIAQLRGSLGSMDGVLPAVNGSLGNALQSAPPVELNGAPSASDLRAATLPSWLRGLPNSAGEIRCVALAKNPETAPVVVLVQDVHNVFSAQKNIAQIVSHIESAAARENRTPVLIGLEGGVGAFDIARFRAFRGSKGHSLASELLLKTNFISGPEYYAFLAEREPLLWGIETPADYIENAEALRASHPATERVTAALSAAQRAVDVKGEAVFSKELKELNRILAAHAQGSATIVDLVRVLRERAPKASAPEIDKLQKALESEAQLDFAQVQRERTALIEVLVHKLDAPSIDRLVSASLNYRAGRISFGSYHAQLKDLVKGHGIRWSDYAAFDRYVRYVLMAENIDKFRLFDELETLKTRAVASSSRTAEEKALMGLAEDLRLAGRLVRYEFGPAEWKAFSAHRNDLNRLQSRMVEVLGSNAVSGPTKEDLALFERFYLAADRRNDSLTANLLDKAKETDAKIMMMVAGGFHTPELESRLVAKGFSVVTVTPTLSEIPKGPNYLDIFLVKNIPIEEFLKGEKLYFSPPRINAGKLLTDSPVKPEAEDRIFGGALRAAEDLGGQTQTQFSNVTAVVTHEEGVVQAVVTTPDGSSVVEAWKGRRSSGLGGEGVSVSEGGPEGMTVALVTGGRAKKSYSTWTTLAKAAAMGAVRMANKWARWFLKSLLWKVETPAGHVPLFWLVGFAALGGLFVDPSASASLGMVFLGIGSINGSGGGLTEWGGATPGQDPVREHLSADEVERLINELVDPSKKYFDLSALAVAYQVSVESLSGLINALGREEKLRMWDGTSTHLLTIARPSDAEGAGPFIARLQDVHKQGFLHDSVVVLAVTPDGRLVLQRHPDMNQYDVGASDHVGIGESPLLAASRELGLELGIDSQAPSFNERLVPIPNPERPEGTFLKEGGRSFSEFLYRDKLDFNGPSKEKNNRENVHLFAILLTADEVQKIEKMGTRVSGLERGGAGFLPLQIMSDMQNRMANATKLMGSFWFPLAQSPTTKEPVDKQDGDRVEMIDPIALLEKMGTNYERSAVGLRHFFQGEKIRGIVTGYLRGLLSAAKLGQNLSGIVKTDRRYARKEFGLTLIAGRPFPKAGILSDVVVALRKGLAAVSKGKIQNLGENAHATLAPLTSPQLKPISAENLSGQIFSEVLTALAETGPMTFEIEKVDFGDLHDGNVVLTIREIGDGGALMKLRERLSGAGLPFEFDFNQMGNRMFILLAHVGTDSITQMTDEEIEFLRRWVDQHRDLKAWWGLHQRYLDEKLRNKPGFSDRSWLEKNLGHPVDEVFLNVWSMEVEALNGKPMVPPLEEVDQILLATYTNRKPSGVVSQGVTLPLGRPSDEFPDAGSLMEQLIIVQAGGEYHRGTLSTDPVEQNFRPSDKKDVTYLPELTAEEMDRLAKIGLENIGDGTVAILAAGAAARMSRGYPAAIIDFLKKFWKVDNPPIPQSKGAVPIAEIDGHVITFLGSFLTNVNAFFLRLRSKGILTLPSVLVYSNATFLPELIGELAHTQNYGLPRSAIDTDLLQKLRPQFGGSVRDVMQMKQDGKFTSDDAYLLALGKARDLEAKLARGEGEAALLTEEKAPHGHGEFLHDMVASGKLVQMISQGKKWIFLRNVDNVGAKLDFNFLVSLGLFVEKGLDFQAEVSPRLIGMKGGALIVTDEGQTILTEGPSFAATWKKVEEILISEGYSPLDDAASVSYVEDVFRRGEQLLLSPTRMDFEGGNLNNLEEAISAVQNDGVRVYKKPNGEIKTVRHVVPESTYWFNNATGLFSLKYFYFVYRRDETQTYAEFIEEMKKAYAENLGGLQAIAQRGKARFPVLMEAKPTKSGGVGQKPENNAWQSTQIAARAGAKLGAIGVDSLRTAKDALEKVRFLATKTWDGKVESYLANFNLYPKIIKAGWDSGALIPDRLFELTEKQNDSKQRGSVVVQFVFLMAGLSALIAVFLPGAWVDPSGMWGALTSLLDTMGSWMGAHVSTANLGWLMIGAVVPGMGLATVQEALVDVNNQVLTEEDKSKWRQAVHLDIGKNGFRYRQLSAKQAINYARGHISNGMANVRSVAPGVDSQEFYNESDFIKALQGGQVVAFQDELNENGVMYYWGPKHSHAWGRQGGFIDIPGFALFANFVAQKLFAKIKIFFSSLDHRTLYERSGGRPDWDNLIPTVHPQFSDLHATKLLIQTKLEMDEFGNLPAQRAKPFFEGTAIQILLTAVLSQQLNSDNQEFVNKARTTLWTFGNTIFGGEVWNKLFGSVDSLEKNIMAGASVPFVAIGKVEQGTLEEYLFTENSVPDMLEKVLDETEQLLKDIQSGKYAKRAAPARVIALTPEARARFSPELIRRLDVLKGPNIQEIKVLDMDRPVSGENLAQQVSRTLGEITSAAKQSGLTVRMITDASTAILLKDQGFDQKTAELLIWIMEGTAVPITAGIETGVRGMMAALKAA